MKLERIQERKAVIIRTIADRQTGEDRLPLTFSTVSSVLAATTLAWRALSILKKILGRSWILADKV